MALSKQVSGTKGSFDEMKTKDKMSQLRKTSEESQALAYARKLGLPYLDLNIYPLNIESLHNVSEEFSRESDLVVLGQSGKILKIATTNPKQETTQRAMEKLSKEGYEIQLFIVSKSGLSRALDKYKLFNLGESIDRTMIKLTGKDLEAFEQEVKELVDLEKKIRSMPTTKVLNIIIAGAIKMEASDIHLEPQKEEVRLRYRIDGMLQNVANIPFNSYPQILSRIKMMSGLKLNVKDTPQDGRFEIKLSNPKLEIDVRVSLLPGNFGENVVLRLLNQDMSGLDVKKLGLSGRPFKQLMKQIRQPNGMVLNTGPTGSGKTTTLYACIKKVNTPGTKIITIENPIEYRLEGVAQTQVEKSRGYDFASGLRAIVRQDPDVLLVGEIRDEETADIAVHSALTGHLVFSTVHANSAAGAIPRLIDLGVRPSLISPAVNAIIGQRLVRKLCRHCREEYVPAPETLETISQLLSVISPKSNVEVPKNITTLYRAKGCPKCLNLGYKGRIGIFEILEINKEVEKLILDLAPASDILAASIESGMVTMLQDGILKAVSGDTSMEEVQRVTGSGEMLKEIYEKIMKKLLAMQVKIDKSQIKGLEEMEYDKKKLNEKINSSSSKETLKYILGGGLFYDAGDVHVEPEEKTVKIRYRIDGILQDIAQIDSKDYMPILSKIKTLSGFKASSHEAVRDSRFGIKLEEPFEGTENTDIDVRVSIIESGYGETVVMRLLNKSAKSLDLKKLGIRKHTLNKLLDQIKKPNGVILNTGPTGSGKTTTLYSLLSILNEPEVKIITVENPIEYRLKGIMQTQVDEKGGYNFSSALRALLRQNPDILMIGEIRDEETAQIAIQASLTGHLVLSTLHTNNAAGSVQRLINMRVDPSDIASAANAFMAQRLVRKLCPYCKKEVKADAETAKQIEEILGSVSEKADVKIPKFNGRVFKPEGCKKCKSTGYSGVIPIVEVITMTQKMQELVANFSITSAIERQAVEDGTITMAQDGVMRAVEGITSMEEVSRVTKE